LLFETVLHRQPQKVSEKLKITIGSSYLDILEHAATFPCPAITMYFEDQSLTDLVLTLTFSAKGTRLASGWQSTYHQSLNGGVMIARNPPHIFLQAKSGYMYTPLLTLA